MEINEHHRQLLGMRTYLNKFAIQDKYDPTSPLMHALQDLLNEKYIVHLDRYYNGEVRRWLNVYILTAKGSKLVADENIVAVSP